MKPIGNNQISTNKPVNISRRCSVGVWVNSISHQAFNYNKITPNLLY